MAEIEIVDHSEHATVKDYLLFALVITGILVSSIFYQNWFGQAGLTEWMRVFMGVFFLVFGLFKVADISGFVDSYANYDLIAKQFPAYGYIYPFIELALAAGFLFNFAPLTVNAATLGIMTVGSVGVAKELFSGRKIKCACLGTYIKLPLSTVSLIEDFTMAGMAAVMLIILL